MSGKNFDHRRGWIRDRLKALAEVFAIDVCAYAVMSNHLHVVLHVDLEQAEGWSDDEVVARYGGLYRLAKKGFEELSTRKARADRVALWRERLSDISWMMRALNEFIARRANKEDQVGGHFWEGRFRSQPILDETGLLTCMAYVDLNPVRAGLASSLEGSEFTSIQDRLQKLASDRKQRRKRTPPASLAAFEDQPGRYRVPFDFVSYVELLQWTGSQMRKKGRLASRPRLLSELGLDGDAWLDALRSRLVSKARFLGSEANIDVQTKRRGGHWSRGVGLARRLRAA